MIYRNIRDKMLKEWGRGKALMVFGPRQCGKTTLLKKLAAEQEVAPLWLNCDEPDDRADLTDKTSTELLRLVGSRKAVFIDEAQRVPNVGLTLKLLVDNAPDIQIVATGSSAFELANSINEPLTGRKFQHNLLPFSQQELVSHYGEREEKRNLEKRLIFGSYPDVINNPSEERRVLNELTESYLYKDIFNFQEIRKPEIIEQLLQAVALQVASEVSFNEISNMLKISAQTIARYLYLLEKTFVIFRLRSFSRNMRNELRKSRKIYFYDNGVRNALISNFNPLNLRADTGALWENFIVSERIKKLRFANDYAKSYFWRTTDQAEIDYLEEKDGAMLAWEIKWNIRRKPRIPKSFIQHYGMPDFEVVTKENYMDLLT